MSALTQLSMVRETVFTVGPENRKGVPIMRTPMAYLKIFIFNLRAVFHQPYALIVYTVKYFL